MACQVASESCGYNMSSATASSSDPCSSVCAASCGRNLHDGDTSTIAESDSESENSPLKQRLADFSDDEETQVKVTKSSEAVGKPRWADLLDNENENEVHSQVAANSEAAAADREKIVPQHVSSLATCSDAASRPTEATTVASGTIQLNTSSHSLDDADCAKRGQAAKRQRKKASWQPEAQPQQKWSHASASSAWHGKGAARNAGRVHAERPDNTATKGAGKGKGKSKGSASNSGPKGHGKGASEKFQCQFTIGIEEDSKFHVVKRIIGQGGGHMKHIAQKTDAKLRLRGRGSKFLEGYEQKESDDVLMLCVSCQDKTSFENAKKLVFQLLEGIYESHRLFCAKAGQNPQFLSIQLHEGYRAGSR